MTGLGGFCTYGEGPLSYPICAYKSAIRDVRKTSILVLRS